MSSFIKNVQNTAHAYKLWSKGSKIIVGVSGGPDSMCLLDLLVSLKKKYDWELRIAHINYGLRGKDSLADEMLVRELARHHNIPYSILKPRITQHNNLEEHLRDVRYAFFEKIRIRYAFDSIAIAHTLDDQAETLLMRLIRGSGLSGLRAMQPKLNMIIRPFLETSRKDIMEHIKERNLLYRTDQSNTDTRFLRNKVRHRLIPYLKRNFNPNIQKVLATTAHIIDEDYTTLLSHVEQCPFTYHQKEGSLICKTTDLLTLSISMQKVTLRNFLTLLLGDTKGITSAHINEILKIIQSNKSKKKQLFLTKVLIQVQGTSLIFTSRKNIIPSA